jgi:hypothetical protein
MLGIFFLVVGISMVVDGKGTAAVMQEAVQRKEYLWMWGLAATATGAIILPLNNMWTSGLPLLITVMGWLALLKGIFILIFPGAAVSLYRKLGTSGLFVFAGIVAIALGLFLLYA